MAEKSKLSIFLSLFPDRHQTFVKSRNSNTWRATSQYHYLTDEEIATAISSRSSLYRAFGNQDKTSFVVIQVQGTSNEAPVQTIKNLHKLLMQKSVKAKPYYIRELDIWQLFIFLSAPTPTLEATAAIENWLSTSWFTVDSETVAVLPNGSPLSIPLQAEFTWLNDDYEPILSASEISLENAASMFLRDLTDCSNMLESLSQLLHSDDQVDQPAYADHQCLIEQPAAPEEQLLNPDGGNNSSVLLESVSCKTEQLDLVVPTVASVEETSQIEDLVRSAYAGTEKFGTSFDGVITSLEEMTASSKEGQILEQSTDPDDLSKPLTVEPDQAAYSAHSKLPETAISLVKSPTSPELEPLPPSQPDNPASMPLSKEQTNVSASPEEEAAYAVDSTQNPVERQSKASTKETSKHSNTRDGPLATQKGRPTIRSNLDSFEQLTLPFEINSS